MGRRTFLLCAVCAVGLSPAVAEEPRAVTAAEALPFGQRPVDYWGTDSHDPIADLQQRILDKQVEMPFDERFGYLPAILRELQIPTESQLLAFSSQSPHRNVIRPERPRAVYFTDDVSVSWFPGAVLLEITSHDSQKGALFYTLVNRSDADLEFYRSPNQTCLGCHHVPGNSPLTGVAVPGHVLRSFLPSEEVRQQPFGEILSHAMPIERRWKSWYVTGISPVQKHRGNLSRSEDRREFEADPNYHRAIVALSDELDIDRYPTDTSDVAAHLVFNHQMLGLNLLSRLSYEHQFHVKSGVETMLLHYLLLADEAPLDHPIFGKSRFAARYGQRGPKDAQGRSLYDLDLKTRLFRRRISPLLHSRMVQNLPPELKQRLFVRLNAVLTGREELHENYKLPEDDRTETLAVLRATVTDWPAE